VSILLFSRMRLNPRTPTPPPPPPAQWISPTQAAFAPGRKQLCFCERETANERAVPSPVPWHAIRFLVRVRLAAIGLQHDVSQSETHRFATYEQSVQLPNRKKWLCPCLHPGGRPIASL
jgi:hypothetical protein